MRELPCYSNDDNDSGGGGGGAAAAAAAAGGNSSNLKIGSYLNNSRITTCGSQWAVTIHFMNFNNLTILQISTARRTVKKTKRPDVSVPGAAWRCC